MKLPLTRALGALLAATVLTSCVPITGVASLTVLSRSEPENVRYEPVGERVEDSECMYWVLLGFGGKALLTHESTLERILQDHDADILLDAQFYNESYGIPYLFMMTCATVEGQPARAVPTGGAP